MARCGISLRYPVNIVEVDDDGSVQEQRCIGDAETLGEAIALAERGGFQVRFASDGGNCRLVQATPDSMRHFTVTTYPH
jgi:hypothetical protein